MSIEPHILAERTVPRYTSYPTTPHFTDAVNAAVYAQWLAQLPRGARLSLYLHVPFCRELCLYCGCHTKAVRQRAPVDSYADDLRREIALLGRALGRHPVSHIHWGGGTPSILGPEQLLTLADDLGRAFAIDDAREHAIELDPRLVDAALADALAAIGINRVSLGVQDFQPHVQHAIGRIQPYETVRRAVELVREAGIARLNFDLMYGLPKQRIDDVRASAELACTLAPQRIALFGYAHVPWFRTQQRLIDAADLPGATERLAQAEAARTTFLAHGYEAVGLDHFALPGDSLALAARKGRLHRNFQGYTDDDAEALIGLGASAIGRLPQGFVQNAPDVGGYARAVRAERLATVRGFALTEEDRTRGQIIERIMCDLRVDLAAVDARGSAAFAGELAALAPLANEGLLRIDGSTVRVSERGRPFVRLVAAAFDSYLAASQRPHSQAV
jgi:oxygen-independent coproporphyrinogen-3 oxidase